MQWKIWPRESDNLITQLLINRAVKTETERENFFHPKLADFEKSLNIPGINKAKTRIEKAIKDGELIIAYGDYDVDGICGAAVLYLGLTAIGAKVLPYIPHREKEGYGLSKIGLESARDMGASLVITTDCGIVNFNEAKFAKELGLDLIITDHHQLFENRFPEALSVIHSTEICGGAVAWCLVRSLVSEKVANGLLDLVSLCTISDMMPLLGINRVFVKEGLKVLNTTSRLGLLALFHEAGLVPGQISAYEIGHIIAPRLNAMGRLEHAIDSLRLLCTKDPVKARKLADLVSETNNQRKELTFQAVSEAKLMVNGDRKKIHVLSSKNWIPGIIGLVAGRVSEETGVSAVAISVGEEFSKGSARAGRGVNIIENIRECSDLLVAVGGHSGAAGFTIETSKIESFRQRLEEVMEVVEITDSQLEIEAEVASNNLKLGLAKGLVDFEPFGVGNQKPILATFNMRLSGLRTVGDGKHLKGRADEIDFIGFGMGELLNILENGQLVNLAYNLEIDKFNGSEKLQLKLKDLQVIF